MDLLSLLFLIVGIVQAIVIAGVAYLIGRGVVRWVYRHREAENWWGADAPVKYLSLFTLVLAIVSLEVGICAADPRFTPGLMVQIWQYSALASFALIWMSVAWVSHNRRDGRGAGMVALATGLAAAMLVVGGFWIFYTVFGHKGKTRTASCISSIKQVSLALLMYADDHDEQLPQADHWQDVLEPYLKNPYLLWCPEVQHAPRDMYRSDYAFNAALAGKKIADIRDPVTVLVFESSPGKNPAGGPSLLPFYPRHDGGDNYAFVDGTARWLRRARDPHAPFWRNQTLKRSVTKTQWEP